MLLRGAVYQRGQPDRAAGAQGLRPRAARRRGCSGLGLASHGRLRCAGACTDRQQTRRGVAIQPHLRSQNWFAGFGGRHLATANKRFGVPLRGCQQLIPPDGTCGCRRWRQDRRSRCSVGQAPKAQSASPHEEPHPREPRQGPNQQTPGKQMNTMRRWGTHKQTFAFRSRLRHERNKVELVFPLSLSNLWQKVLLHVSICQQRNTDATHAHCWHVLSLASCFNIHVTVGTLPETSVLCTAAKLPRDAAAP
mgnify:CR=1 FL=1